MSEHREEKMPESAAASLVGDDFQPGPAASRSTPTTEPKPADASAGAESTVGTPWPTPLPDRRIGIPPPIPGANARLKTDKGTTQIADLVVVKLASIATQEMPGVYTLGKGLARAIAGIRSRIPGSTTDTTKGISVEVGERQAAVDIDIVVEYGYNLVEVTEAVRANVIERIEGITGLEVVEVNITVDDLHLAGDEVELVVPPNRVE